jgi:TrmH RNA methyltransferase
LTIGAEARARSRLRDLAILIREKSGDLRAGPRTRRAGRPGIALVLGNEETGLSGEVKDNCAALVRVPGSGLMESLNVAQVAALFLHELYAC